MLTVLSVTGVAAQPNPASTDEQPTASAEPVEEITVVGHRFLRELRLEVQESRERVYDLFNSLNSNEEFDLHCSTGARTGTRTLRRVCRPQFVDDATNAAGKWFTAAIKSGGWFDGRSMAQAEMAVVPGKERLLAEEVQRLTRENRQFRRAIAEYQAVEGRYEDALQEVVIEASATIIDTARAVC